MNRLAPRQPIPFRAFSWGRVVDDKTVTWRLFRRDHRRRVHMSSIGFSRNTDRRTMAGALWHARIALRNRVDEIDLQAWGIAA